MKEKVSPMHSESSISHALRAHIRTHNLGVLSAVVFILIFTSALWTGIYFLCYWLLFFKHTVLDQDIWITPSGFIKEYAAVAVALVIAARFLDQLIPPDKARDHRSKLELVINLLMFLPRCTLNMLESLSALVWFSKKHLKAAALFIEYLQHHGRMNMQELPLAIPDESMRNRILFGLDIMQIVEVRLLDNVFWLSLSSITPKAFQTTSPRSQTPKVDPPETPPPHYISLE